MSLQRGKGSCGDCSAIPPKNTCTLAAQPEEACPFEESLVRVFQQTRDELFATLFHILGSPEDCWEQLRPCWEQVGANFLVLRTHWSGMPVGHALSSMRLISDALLPALRRL